MSIRYSVCVSTLSYAAWKAHALYYLRIIYLRIQFKKNISDISFRTSIICHVYSASYIIKTIKYLAFQEVNVYILLDVLILQLHWTFWSFVSEHTEMKFIVSSLESSEATLQTSKFNIKKCYLLPTQRFYVLCVVSKADRKHFLKHNQIIVLHNLEGVCLQCGRKWTLYVIR
jgi:hypothetical protein